MLQIQFLILLAAGLFHLREQLLFDFLLLLLLVVTLLFFMLVIVLVGFRYGAAADDVVMVVMVVMRGRRDVGGVCTDGRRLVRAMHGWGYGGGWRW